MHSTGQENVILKIISPALFHSLQLPKKQACEKEDLW